MTTAATNVDQLRVLVASELVCHPVQVRAGRVHRARHIRLGLRPELSCDDAFVGGGHLCPPCHQRISARLCDWHNDRDNLGISTPIIDHRRGRQKQLGEFLRAQCERLNPQAVGLGSRARRRTPGLRPEEVALLAGMSTTWYIRIEHGRDVGVLPHAISRLAEALRLSGAERSHLFELAGLASQMGPPLRHAGPLPAHIAASVKVIDAPAYVLDANWTARAWNTKAAWRFCDWLQGPD
jgi:transcriptional regulator with XRE-family HTH domain